MIKNKIKNLFTWNKIKNLFTWNKIKNLFTLDVVLICFVCCCFILSESYLGAYVACFNYIALKFFMKLNTKIIENHTREEEKIKLSIEEDIDIATTDQLSQAILDLDLNNCAFFLEEVQGNSHKCFLKAHIRPFLLLKILNYSIDNISEKLAKEGYPVEWVIERLENSENSDLEENE